MWARGVSGPTRRNSSMSPGHSWPEWFYVFRKNKIRQFLRIWRQIKLSFEGSWLSWALLYFISIVIFLFEIVLLIVSRSFEDFENRVDNQLFSTWISLRHFIVAFSTFKSHHLSPKILIFWSESYQLFSWSTIVICFEKFSNNHGCFL